MTDSSEISVLEYRLERAVNWEPDAHRRELERENQRLRDALAEIDDWLENRRPTVDILRRIVAKALPQPGDLDAAFERANNALADWEHADPEHTRRGCERIIAAYLAGDAEGGK